ncbi:MAG: type II toxin-antitoxin system RelE/ParE family toxin [Pirellulales bacterium]|nr:type II toxin-antitoxin system RelE/ParE family toxin [Pirellulales bacterium]
MTGRILRRDSVFRDLDDLAAYIQKQSPEAAIRFLQASESSFQLLATNPNLANGSGSNDPSLPNSAFGKSEDLRIF